MLLPIAVLAHQLEEWFGGFLPWVESYLGASIGPDQFLAVNAVGLVLFTGATLAAVRFSGAAWMAAAIAALVGLNGVMHVAGSLLSGRYSAGAVTGLVLFIPLGAAVLRSSADRMSKPVLAASVVAGVLFHALATYVALR